MPDEVLKRVPPRSIEAEQSVLGAVLLDNRAIDAALELIAPEDFYRDAHHEVFAAMLALSERNEPIDAVTLTDLLKTRGRLEQIGGVAYIADLADAVPTAANVAYYAKIVREKSLLRAAAGAGTAIASEAYEQPSDVEDFLDRAEHRMFVLGERRVRTGFYAMPELTRDGIRILERLYENNTLLTGLATGFADLDSLTAGFQPGDLVVVAARPGMGKTAFALNVASHVACAMDPPMPVAFFSLEMAREQLVLRMLCSEARVDSAKARAGYLSRDDFPRLAESAARLSKAPIFIDDASDTTPLGLKAKCRRLAHERGALGLVIVDYLQLMRGSTPTESREREIAEISRSMKALAKELRVPVLALSQLNRQVESRSDRRPLLADLRESGAIEQDADVIAFIYRDEVYHGRKSKEPGVAEIIVAKQRNGPTDTVKLTYIAKYTRFEDHTAATEPLLEEEG